LDDGDDHPLFNERPSKKDVQNYRQGEYATNTSSLHQNKVHQPESSDTADYGLGPKMARGCSRGTQPPPPPPNRSKPGAVRVPGFQTDTATSTDNLASESTSQSAPTKSSAPILQASVVVDEQEQSSTPNRPSASMPVLAEPMKEGEESSKRSSSCCAMLKDRRLLTILVILIIIIIAFAIGITLVVMNKETITTNTVEYIATTPAPTTATTAPTAPTAAPTEAPEFLPPSRAQCERIEAGEEVENQDQLILKTYHIELDVAISDFASLTPLVNQMQAILAPMLAQCDDILNRSRHRQLRRNARIQGGHRKLISDYLVANAKFSKATVQTNRSCKAGATQPCYKVIQTIDLYIKQDELDVRLISLIMDAFDGESLVDLLDLGYPFESIDMIGVTSSSMVDVNNNMDAEREDDDSRDDED